VTDLLEQLSHPPYQPASFYQVHRLLCHRPIRQAPLRGGKISNIPQKDIGKAVVCFQYVERIKSELIIAAKLLEFIIDLKDDEQSSANKLFRWYLDAVLGEINIAHNVIGRQDFLQAREKVTAALEKVQQRLFEDAIRQVSEAISAVASSGQWAMQVLKDNGFL